MHSCCHTHQLQPQRLLTQARHLRTVQSVSQETESAVREPRAGVREGKELTVQTGKTQ